MKTARLARLLDRQHIRRCQAGTDFFGHCFGLFTNGLWIGIELTEHEHKLVTGGVAMAVRERKQAHQVTRFFSEWR